ncbi:MAG TPA: YihY/virulence factor BrkB family protein [Actinomycetota bacterium]|nr:YihY/virulence factor BrkB family protein [Actinomycetota bacterium]
MAEQTSLSDLIDRVQERLPKPVGSFIGRLRGEDVMMPASGLAFYALVSFAPLLIVSVWVVGLLAGESRVQQLSQQVREAAPPGMGLGSLVRQVAQEGISLGVGAVAAALWPATAYGSALARGFERLDGGSRDELRGLRGRGLAILVILPMFVLGILGAAFFGTTLLKDGITASILGPVLGLVFGFAAAFVGSAVIYWIFPLHRLPWGRLARAAVLAATLIAVLSVLFVLYLNVGADFKDSYASSTIAGMVLLGVWLFLSNAVLLAVHAGATER